MEDGAAFPPRWLSLRLWSMFLPFHPPSPSTQPRRGGGRWEPAGPAPALVAQVGKDSVCVVALPPPTLSAPHLTLHSHGFPQPGITRPSHLDLVAHKEQVNLGTQCNLLIPSRVPLPQYHLTHTHSGKGCQGLGRNKTQTWAKIYIYNYIHICICREEKLGMLIR